MCANDTTPARTTRLIDRLHVARDPLPTTLIHARAVGRVKVLYPGHMVYRGGLAIIYCTSSPLFSGKDLL